MTPGGSPLVARRRLGSELRRLREAAGLTVEHAAAELECSASKVSRLETGIGLPRSRDVRDLIRLYGAAAESHSTELLELAEEGRSQSWYDDFSDVVNPQSAVHRLIGLEAGATEILSYGGSWIPALLQTEDYALAVTRASSPELTERNLQRQAELRLRRQAVLRRDPNPVRLQAIIDESAILRPAGGPAVMQKQLEKLLVAVESPLENLHVQLLPLSKGMHGLVTGHLTILRFDDDDQSDVVFSEGHTGDGFEERPEAVQRYEEMFHRAQALAVDGEALAARLRNALSSKPRVPIETRH